MARIRPLEDAEAQPAARDELYRQLAASGRVTNMKRTLAHSPPALTALTQWYPLSEAMSPSGPTPSVCTVCLSFCR
jgi:hypothetical protein